MREFEVVSAVENKGFQDCIHGRSGSTRQVLLMDLETLEEFGIAPGRVRETSRRGIALETLALGERLRAGEALLEVTKPCEPCHQMTKSGKVFRKRFAGGAAFCAALSNPAASAVAIALKLKNRARIASCRR